jgi:hypothetical protein
MSVFNYPSVCDLVEFYGIALMLLTALMKCYGCGGMAAVVLLVSFAETLGLKRVY